MTKPSGHTGIISNHYIFGQIHISMDDSSRIQNAMISAIWQADTREMARIASDKIAPPTQNAPLDTTITSSISQLKQRIVNKITTPGN